MRRMETLFSLTCTLLTLFTGCLSQDDFPVLKGPYLGQKPPGKEAEIFAPELINYEVHGSPYISQDEKEIIIGSMTEGPKYYKMIDGVWSLQAVLPFAIPKNCNGMFVSPSGKRVYFLIWEDNDENFYFIETKGNKCCLLYTSPSPRDQRGSRMPSSA